MSIKTRKGMYYVVLIISTLTCVILSEVYRPWAYSVGLSDFGIATSGVSFFGAISAVFLTFILEQNRSCFYTLSLACIGCVAYEFLQPLLHTGTFDIKDIVGIFLGIVFSAILYKLISVYENKN